MTPDAFGPFRSLQQIGAGALGPVFRAHLTATDCPVALKVFSLGLHADRLRQLLTHLDLLVAARLDCLNIATPLAAGTSGASAYLAQELVSGHSLEVVRRDRLIVAPADVARLATEIASALDCAAAGGIVHGRLNPRDVIVSDDGIRLTGLGIARALESLDVTAPPRDPYAAPERVAWLPWGSRADTFSLAAMMFELLWGRSIAGLAQEAIEGIEDVPGADLRMLRRVFAQGLAVDPADRFESASDFAAALECACAPALSLTPQSRHKPLTITGASSPPTAPVATVLSVLSAIVVAPRMTMDCVIEEDEKGRDAIDGLDAVMEEPIVLTLMLAADPAETTIAPEEPPVEQVPVMSNPLAAAALAEIALLLQATSQEPASTRVVSAPARSQRRYSAWWAFLLGPAVGAAIGYLLVPALDRYRGDAHRRRPEIHSLAPAFAGDSSPDTESFIAEALEP